MLPRNYWGRASIRFLIMQVVSSSVGMACCNSREAFIGERAVDMNSIGTQTSSSSSSWTHINHETQRRNDVRFAAKYLQFVQVNYGKIKRVSQDGKIHRPTPSIVGFLEDHAEFMFDSSLEERENLFPSYLESTVDGSLIKGARRSYTPRVSTQDLDFFIDTAIRSGSGGGGGNRDQDPLIALDELDLKTEIHKYRCSKCEFESRCRHDVENHILLTEPEHSEAVVEVLLSKEARGKTCPMCDVKLQESQLFKHIRCSHRSNFPLRCGYCVFFGQDYNQLRHHIKKKHNTSDYQIIDIARTLAQTENPGKDEGGVSGDEFTTRPNIHQEFVCPLCDETLKTLTNLKKHIMKHSRKKQKCLLCPFTTSLPRQVKRHFERRHPNHTPRWQTKLVKEETYNGATVEDVTPVLKLITAKYGLRQPNKVKGWIRQYRCPHCDYTCNFNSSYNRHMRIHKGIKPFKCGHCDFHARESYLVRRHSTKTHKGKPILIEGGKTLKAPYRYSYRKLKAEQQSVERNTEESEVRIPTPDDSWMILPVPSTVEKDISQRKASVQKIKERQNIKNCTEGKITGSQNTEKCTEGKITERPNIEKCTERKITERQNIEQCAKGSEPKYMVITESWTVPLSASTSKEKNEPREADQHTNQWHLKSRCSTSDHHMYESVEKSSYDEQIRHQREDETLKPTQITDSQQDTVNNALKTLPTSTQTQIYNRPALYVREKEQRNTCRPKNWRKKCESLQISVQKQTPNLAGDIDQSVDNEPQHESRNKESLCDNHHTSTDVMKKLPAPLKRSTPSSCVNEDDENEVDNNIFPLVTHRAPSARKKLVQGPSTDVDIPIMRNGEERKQAYDVSKTYSSDDTRKLHRTSEKHKTGQTKNVSESHCQIYLVESDWSCCTPSSVVISFENMSLMHPVISQSLEAPEAVGINPGINTGNPAVTQGFGKKVQSVIACGHTEMDRYQGISIVSGHSNAFPIVFEPGHGSAIWVKTSGKSRFSTVHLQDDVFQEEMQVKRETRLQDHPTQSEIILENITHIESVAENVKETSEVGARGGGEKVSLSASPSKTEEGSEKILSKSPAKIEVGLENNLHTHIAFLVDSREQQRTSSESVSPRIVTRNLQGTDYSNSDYFSSETVRSMMKRRKDGQATCALCGVTTTYRAFYKHAKKHFNIKPFKCGYCSYRSIEKSKIRVHNTFCHSSKPCLIQKLSPEHAVLQNTQAHTHRNSSLKSELNSPTPLVTDNENDETTEKKSQGDTDCSSISVVHVTDERSPEWYHQNKGSVVCETQYEAQMTHSHRGNVTCSSDQSAKDCTHNKTHRSQVYKCPVCSKVMKKHTPSMRRHLYSHYSYKPYKCGYCSFTGCGPAEVRAHQVTHGPTVLPRVEHRVTQMPTELATYARNMLSHKRRISTLSRGRHAIQPTSPTVTASDYVHLRQGVSTTTTIPTPSSSKQDVHVTQEKASQNLLLLAHGQDNSVEAPEDDLTTTTVQAQMQRETMASKTELGIASGPLPPLVDLNLPSKSRADADSDSVCVVYLIDGEVLQSSHR